MLKQSTGGALGLDDSEAAALSELWRLACDQGQEPDSQYTEHLTRSIMTAVFGQSRDEVVLSFSMHLDVFKPLKG